MLNLLHTFHTKQSFNNTLDYFKLNSSLVFLGEGVYNLSYLTHTSFDNLCMNYDIVCAIQSDVEARGITRNKFLKLKLINYEELAQLCMQYHSILTW